MQNFLYYKNFEEDRKDPGPQPVWRPHMTDEEYRAYNREVMIWEAKMVRFALIDGNLEMAYREEAQRDAMVKSRGLDPRVCNRNMSRRT